MISLKDIFKNDVDYKLLINNEIENQIKQPDKYSKMTHPYIFIDSTGLQTDNINAPKNRVPWFASQTDMLSDDWEVCE